MELKPKRRFWIRLHDFVHRHRVLVPIVCIIGVLLAGGLVAFVLFYPKGQAQTSQQASTETPPPPPPKYYSPLTGVEVPDEATTKSQVRAIIIENSPDARPQSGLKEAGIVFEAIAEGGITRLLCLYQEGSPGLIGPVRSLRPYYIDWLAPYDATVSHVGGSYNALQEIRNGQYKDIDQFFNGAYYWRATDRYAPHNVYTSTAKLNELNQKKGFISSTFAGFPRKDDSPLATPAASSINVPISSSTYNATYSYDLASNSYLRNLGGKPHTDRELGQIQPKTVIVMKVEMRLGFEDGYREQMSTLGSGKAYIFQDGGATEGTWHKADKKSQIEFKDAAGAPIALNRGQTWISVTTPDKPTTWQ